MDEATSALDLAAETQLYRSLMRLPLTLISIGHRPALRDYHDRVIELQPLVSAARESDQRADAGAD
jgi:putative ATP-binding cassette transporter